MTRLATQAKWASSALKEAFAEYETKVVVNYRRYFDWLISEYNQQEKPVVCAGARIPENFPPLDEFQ
jgi:hypothetical protein